MGNRAIIMDADQFENEDLQVIVGMYVHSYWDEEMNEWLATCKERGYRSTTDDPGYGMARLCQVACESTAESGLNIGMLAVDKSFKPFKDCWLDVGYVLIRDYEVVRIIDSDE